MNQAGVLLLICIGLCEERYRVDVLVMTLYPQNCTIHTYYNSDQCGLLLVGINEKSFTTDAC